MSGKLNRPAYQRLIDEDIAEVLREMSPGLERTHIVAVLRESVRLQYDEIPGVARRWIDSYGPDDA